VTTDGGNGIKSLLFGDAIVLHSPDSGAPERCWWFMSCQSCGSSNQTEYGAEINIHYPGLKDAEKPSVLIFPKIAVCLDCGFTEFAIPGTELRLLRERGAAASAA
jgi:hypothetical protein